MKYTKALVLTLATSLAGLANAGGTQSWSNVSDVLAIGLPLVAAGKALTSGDNEGVKEPDVATLVSKLKNEAKVI